MNPQVDYNVRILPFCVGSSLQWYPTVVVNRMKMIVVHNSPVKHQAPD